MNTCWSAGKAKAWYKEQGWIIGANFIPSTAVNTLEMWQKETFDATTIDTELGYAEEIGMNTMRVFLHNLIWENDKKGFLERIEKYLKLANKHSIKTVFVLLDGVWDPSPKWGKQEAPIPFLHNSRWVQSPGKKYLENPKLHLSIEGYVKGIVKHFAKDKRVLMWDLFNEADNTNIIPYGKVEVKNKSKLVYGLLIKVFMWAREVNPTQPITSAPWENVLSLNKNHTEVNSFMLNNSDIISFHNYQNKKGLKNKINEFKRLGRPVVCTEYLARPKSNFFNCLPLMKTENVGCFNWGLVSGKTQTIFPWTSWALKPKRAPKIWFHDIFKKNGEPFDEKEIDLIKSLTN